MADVAICSLQSDLPSLNLERMNIESFFTVLPVSDERRPIKFWLIIVLVDHHHHYLLYYLEYLCL